MIAAPDRQIAARARYLTNQAKDDTVRYVHNETGFNYRMTNIQAAIGCAQLEAIEKYIEAKRRNFEAFKSLLKGVKGISLADEPEYGFSNRWLYSLIVDKRAYGTDRDGLMTKMSELGIETRPLWKLNHTQRPFAKCPSYRIERAFHFEENLLNIPSSVGLTDADIRRIAEAIKHGR